MKHDVINTLIRDEPERAEESMKVGLILSLSIGILNACTYVTRGHVFASSQSGNLLYLGLDFAEGDFSNVIKYLFPPIMFGIGIIIAEHYHDKPNYSEWRKYPFYIEIALIIAATFMPDSWNALANPIFGLACGLQSITFAKVRGIPVSTIVIVGSYQNSLVHLTRFLHLKDEQDAFRALLYITIVISYIIGIVIGAALAPALDHYVSLISAVMLYGCSFIALAPVNKKSESKSKK